MSRSRFSDRLNVLRAPIGIKAPCRAATTANITLDGFQVIDGVAFAVSDAGNGLSNRVLVMSQTDATENGIYTIDGYGAWARAADFDHDDEIAKGTRVFVTDGTTNAQQEFAVTTADPITIGGSSIAFTALADGTTAIALSLLNINAGTAETTPAVGDKSPFYDISAAANRTITFEHLFKILGLLTAETAPAIDDVFGIYDTSATAARSMTFADFLKVVNGLTEDASPDTANDFVLSYDTSAGAARKVKPSNLASTISAASAAEQETGTEAGKYVAPATQHRHASAAKAWVRFNASGTVAASYNVASITDTGVGRWTVVIATDFSSANYGAMLTGGFINSGNVPIFYNALATAAGSFDITGMTAADTFADPDLPNAIFAAFFGDQA